MEPRTPGTTATARESSAWAWPPFPAQDFGSCRVSTANPRRKVIGLANHGGLGIIVRHHSQFDHGLQASVARSLLPNRTRSPGLYARLGSYWPILCSVEMDRASVARLFGAKEKREKFIRSAYGRVFYALRAPGINFAKTRRNFLTAGLFFSPKALLPRVLTLPMVASASGLIVVDALPTNLRSPSLA